MEDNRLAPSFLEAEPVDLKTKWSKISVTDLAIGARPKGPDVFAPYFCRVLLVKFSW